MALKRALRWSRAFVAPGNFAYRIRHRRTTIAVVTAAVLRVCFLGQRANVAADADATVLFQNALTRGQPIETGQAIRSARSVLLCVPNCTYTE